MNTELCISDLELPKYKLGSGEFGRVFEAVHEGKPVVYKIMKHAIHNHLIFENELNILSSLRDMSNIPKLYGYARCEERNLLYIVMEKAPGMTLYHYICYNEEAEISLLRRLFIAANICRTLFLLHRRCILYRDMKPDNLMIDPTTCHHMLVDFGLSTQCKSMKDRVEGSVGTPGYMAPEIFRQRTYGFSADVYSLGMTFYFLFTYREPERLSMVYANLKKAGLPRPLHRLLLQCIRTDPRQRPTAEQLYHQFSCLYEEYHQYHLRQQQRKRSFFCWFC